MTMPDKEDVTAEEFGIALQALIADGLVTVKPRPDGTAGYMLTEAGFEFLNDRRLTEMVEKL
jgi:hypothetical protein